MFDHKQLYKMPEVSALGTLTCKITFTEWFISPQI